MFDESVVECTWKIIPQLFIRNASVVGEFFANLAGKGNLYHLLAIFLPTQTSKNVQMEGEMERRGRGGDQEQTNKGNNIEVISSLSIVASFLNSCIWLSRLLTCISLYTLLLELDCNLPIAVTWEAAQCSENVKFASLQNRFDHCFIAFDTIAGDECF